MTQRGQKYLFDILQAVELVEEFVHDLPDFNAYRADAKTRSAVERQLGIIGEAVNHLRRVWPEAELPGSKQIVDFCNHLVHAYDNIDDVIVWAILKRHLPVLKVHAQQRLNAEPPPQQ